MHGKRSILGRMPGDEWQRFANARVYFGFMWGYPGKKLLFMGQEFGQIAEWNDERGLDWHLTAFLAHRGLQAWVRDLNHAYVRHPALHARDCEPEGFRWIVVDDRDQSVFAWQRSDGEGGPPVVVVCNFTPVPRPGYRIGLPGPDAGGRSSTAIAEIYGGSGVGNGGSVIAVEEPSHGLPASAEFVVPPLAALYLVWDEEPV